MGCKTLISFNLQKYVEKHPIVSAQQNTKIRWATGQTTLFLICLISHALIEKRSKCRLTKEIFIIVKNICTD